MRTKVGAWPNLTTFRRLVPVIRDTKIVVSDASRKTSFSAVASPIYLPPWEIFLSAVSRTAGALSLVTYPAAPALRPTHL